MLEEEIKDAIRKNLPEEVGQTLKSELEELNKLRSESAYNKDLIKSKNTQIEELNHEIYTLRNLLAIHEELDSKIEGVEKRERDLEVRILTTQLTAQTEKAQFAQDLAMGLVRNTEYRKIIDSSNVVMDSHTDSQGYCSYTTVPDSLGSIKTAE